MSDDFQQRAEEARRARMQGMKPRTDGIVPPRAPQKNRIEEALGVTAQAGKPVTSFTGEATPIIPPIAPKVAAPIRPNAVAEKQKTTTSYGRFLKRFFLGILVLILLAAVGTGGYIAFKAYKAPKVATPDQIVQAVGKLVSLPDGEKPTVATVSDLAPLKDQPFFKDALIGDKVLIFSTSKKAILYRPSTNKVITVAPLNQ